MSTATAVKIATAEQEALSQGLVGECCARGGVCCRAHACLAKRLDAELERAHGLPMTSYEVLHHLEESAGGRMRMCDLAEQAQLSRSGLTRLVDRLEREGLLERCSCEHDARGSYACLTDDRARALGGCARHASGGRQGALPLALLRERVEPAGGHVGAHRSLHRLLSRPARRTATRCGSAAGSGGLAAVAPMQHEPADDCRSRPRRGRRSPKASTALPAELPRK